MSVVVPQHRPPPPLQSAHENVTKYRNTILWSYCPAQVYAVHYIHIYWISYNIYTYITPPSITIGLVFVLVRGHMIYGGPTL